MQVRTIAKTLNVVAMCSHFFCCFLPGVISLITLITLAGTAVVTMEDFGIPEYVHAEMIYISAVVLILTGIVNYISWKIDCRAVACTHEPCGPKKSQYFKLYGYSAAFFLLNAVIHFTLHVK